MNHHEDINELSIFLNKWKRKNPLKWSRLDTFCWMFDWFFTRDIAIIYMESFLADLPDGYILCHSSHEYFTSHFEKHGLELFENLHIEIASYYGFYRKSPKVR